MEQYLDRVTEAYKGDLGPAMAQKTRKRVHWISKQAQGAEILDVGCSQGLISILLGREGKNVTGIDISSKTIEFANESLMDEMEDTKKSVHFIAGDFLKVELEDECYDTIIITEVLEHLISSHKFLEKAYRLLKDDGKVIITVPFGINDFPDHKRTLYLMEILKELHPFVSVEDVEFFGKWIGFVGKKKKEINSLEFKIDNALFERAEEAFFTIERELVDKVSAQKSQLEKFKQKQSEYQKKLANLQIDYTSLKDTSNKRIYEMEIVEREKLFYKENYNEIKKESLSTQEALKQQYEQRERELERKISNLENKIEDVTKENYQLENDLSKEIKEKSSLFNEINNLKQLNEQFKKHYDLEKENTTRLTSKAAKEKLEKEKAHELLQQTQMAEQKLQKDLNEARITIEQLNTKVSTLLKEKDTAQMELVETENIKESYVTKLKNEKEANIKLRENLVEELKDKELLLINLKNLQKETIQPKLLIDNLEAELDEKEKEIRLFSEENRELHLKTLQLVNEYHSHTSELKEELLIELNQKENIIKEFMKDKRKLELIEQKYNNLKNSKMGRLAVRYWEVKKRF